MQGVGRHGRRVLRGLDRFEDVLCLAALLADEVGFLRHRSRPGLDARTVGEHDLAGQPELLAVRRGPGVIFPGAVLVFAGLFLVLRGDLFVSKADAAADLDEIHSFKPFLKPPGGQLRIGAGVAAQFPAVIEAGRALQPLRMNQKIHEDMAALDAEVRFPDVPRPEVIADMRVPFLIDPFDSLAPVIFENPFYSFPGERAALRATHPRFSVQHLQGPTDSLLLFLFVPLAVVLEELRKLLTCLREARLVVEHDALDSRSHARFAQFDIEFMTAGRACRWDEVGGQLLFGDDGRAEDRSSMIAVSCVTGSVLGPEGVDDLRPFPPVPAALVRGDLGGIDVHDIVGLPVHPAPRVAPRTGRGVEGLNEGLYLGLDCLEERFDLFGVAARKLVLRHEPGHGIEIDARHLKAKPSAFDQGGPASHEDVEHPELAKMPGLLVVAVVMVPDSFGRLGRIFGRFCGGRDQQAPKDARAATGPPFGHLIDGFARIAFEI